MWLVLHMVSALLVVVGKCSEKQPAFPEVTFNSLQRLVDGGNRDVVLASLADEGEAVGAFAVTSIPAETGFSEALAGVLEKAPECIGQDTNLPLVTLADGSTRRTYATQDSRTFPECVSDQLTTLSDVFDTLESLVTKVTEILAGKDLKYHLADGSQPVPLESAPHKDHIHVYKKQDVRSKSMKPSGGHHERHKRDVSAHPDDESSPYLVPFHIDNGLFLIITPFPEHSLRVKVSSGRTVTTQLSSLNSVLVLYGHGLTSWMLQAETPEIRNTFFPVPHAVPSMEHAKVQFRSVYARMKVAPATAEPWTSSTTIPNGLKDFHHVFMKGFDDDRSRDSQVCSVDLSSSRDAFAKAMDASCAEGEAYCWMGCFPLPKDCPSVEEAFCFSKVTNVTCSTKPSGKPMDPTCKWECKPKVKPQYQVSKYCNGKMDMLMFGFDTTGKKDNPCIILFFDAWTLDNRVKFTCACVGVLLLGFSIEALVAFRRSVSRKKRVFLNVGEMPRKVIILSSFAVNLVMGYLAMLVAMTYSIELFSCVVTGLVLGHALFNLNTAVGESIDPCCASQNDVQSRKRPVEQSDPVEHDRLLVVSATSPVSNGSFCSDKSKRNCSDLSCSSSVNTTSLVQDARV